jgi:DNA-directed RNA polymerase subunit RPC12/RpoP
MFEARLQCSQCGRDYRVERSWTFFLGPYARCPSCGDYAVQPLRGRDPIDRMWLNPISYLQRFLFAPLYHCALCRLQFYDWRRRRPNHTTET